jgi:hypothetical protein
MCPVKKKKIFPGPRLSQGHTCNVKGTKMLEYNQPEL